jgi:general secretion pathway protein E
MPLLEEKDRSSHAELGQRLSEAIESGVAGPSAAGDSDIQVLADALLRDAVRARASDVHLDPQTRDVALRFRIDGAMVDVSALEREPARRILNQFKTLTKLDPVSLFAPEESRFTYTLDGEDVDLRVAFAPCVAGEKMTIRLLDTRQLRHDIRELGLPNSMLGHVERWLNNVAGMFLVTGPTGSGKTTTLYALLHELRLLERSIITLEDPVEYQVDGITQLQVDDEHDLTFRNGLKAMLRLDPDFLLLGEIRDVASARAAAAAASTGHVLLSTLHSHDPVSAITTLRNWGLEDYEITASLQVVVAQRLVRRLCPACRREAAPDPRERSWLRAIGEAVPESVWHAVGCDECRGLGYKGRVGVFEVWRLQDEDLELIAEHTTERILRQRLRDRDHETLLGDGLSKARAGETTLCELMGSRLVRRCAKPSHGSSSLRAASATGAEPARVGESA